MHACGKQKPSLPCSTWNTLLLRGGGGDAHGVLAVSYTHLILLLAGAPSFDIAALDLQVSQIAKREFGVNRTVARASNPKNRDILHTLGVDTDVYKRQDRHQ